MLLHSYTILCYATLCYVMLLCCAMLCYAMLSSLGCLGFAGSLREVPCELSMLWSQNVDFKNIYLKKSTRRLIESPSTDKRGCSDVIVSGTISINGYTTHHTHTLSCHEGEYYCVKCGYLARKRIVCLKRPCHGPEMRTQHGKLTLEQVGKGSAPSQR